MMRRALPKREAREEMYHMRRGDAPQTLRKRNGEAGGNASPAPPGIP